MNRTWLARIGVSLLAIAGLVVVAGVAYRIGVHDDAVPGIGREIVIGDDGTRAVVVDGWRGRWGGGPGFGFFVFPLVIVGLVLLFRSRRDRWNGGLRGEAELRDWHHRQHVADVPVATVPAAPAAPPTIEPTRVTPRPQRVTPRRRHREHDPLVTHVLVVDDEPAIVEIVRDYLVDAGYRVSSARSGEEALAVFRSVLPDLIVLDLGLPGVDGLDVARTVRHSSSVPIIVLTARGDETDRIVGLELGADDYVTKPFSPRELLARVRAVLRRTGVGDEDEGRAVAVGDLVVDPGAAARRGRRRAGRS